MTRKDYVKLASELHATRPDNRDAKASEQWASDVEAAVRFFGAGNPGFDSVRFRSACMYGA